MILAIYSKGRFDKEARGLAVGEVFAIDRYTSKHKGLTPLAEGGALFVVTVRPGDVLWLVAVLESPAFKNGAWVAAKNTVPIADISQLVDKIQFTSGKGIKAGKGKLGMSLQTPRALSSDDIALLREAAGGAGSTRRGEKRAKAADKNDAKPNQSLARAVKYLGDGWRIEGAHLRHEASGAAFAYVPGGWLRMGFSLDDIYDACRARRRRPFGEDSDWPGEIAAARPPRMVKVMPFVIAVERHPLDEDTFKADFRHPSEAELEWVFRRAGRDRWVGVPGDKAFRANTRQKLVGDIDPPFGIALEYDADHEYCADDWHGNYEGAPSTSAPWGDGNEVYRMLHSNWQDDDEEMISIHAAYRMGPGSPTKRWRPCMALAKHRHDRAGKDAPDAIEASQLMAALASDDKADRKAAGWALELVVDAPAADVAAPLAHIIANLPADSRSLRESLSWLGAVTMGRAPHKADRQATLRASLRETLPKPDRSKAWRQLEALLEHDDKKVRAAAVPVITAACMAAGKGTALVKRLSNESDKMVAAAIVIGLALLGEAAPDTGDKKFERALAKVRVLSDGLRGLADPMAIAAAMDVRGLAQLPWFGGELYDLGWDLLRARPRDERERMALALEDDVHLAFSLVFSRVPRGRLKDDTARVHRLRKSRLDELSPAQVTVLERSGAGSGSGYMTNFGLADSELGFAIMFGRSEAMWAKPIKTATGELPAYFALTDLHAQSVVDGIDVETYQARVLERLSDWTLHDILRLGAETDQAPELRTFQGPMHDERSGLRVWPFEDQSEQINLIKRMSKRKRAAYRRTHLERLRSHQGPLSDVAEQTAWRHLLHLASCLDPGEAFPADVLPDMMPDDFGAFHNLGGHHPIDMPEPHFDHWLCTHLQPHIERAIAGKKQLAAYGYIWLGDIVAPSWSAASVLTILAYQMSDGGFSPVYTRLQEEPTLAEHRASIPEMVHDKNGDGVHPKPRAAAKALWAAAQAARGVS